MEQTYARLMKMKPSLTIMISATPIPLILELTEDADGVSTNWGFEMCNLKLIDDYIDLDLIQPLYIDEDGKHVYLYLDKMSCQKRVYLHSGKRMQKNMGRTRHFKLNLSSNHPIQTRISKPLRQRYLWSHREQRGPRIGLHTPACLRRRQRVRESWASARNVLGTR